MPGKTRSVIYWRAKLLTLIGRPRRMALKPILMACGLLIIAGVLLAGVSMNINRQPRVAGIEALPKAQLAAPPTAPTPAPQAVPALESIAAKENQTPQAKPSSAPAAPAVNPAVQAKQWTPPGPVRLDYGWQEHPLYKDWRFHTGIDYDMAQDRPVLNILAGEVVQVERTASEGLAVTVASGDYRITYAALAGAAVKEGTRVAAGARLGLAGTSPSEPYAHLHLAVKKKGQSIDPKTLLE